MSGYRFSMTRCDGFAQNNQSEWVPQPEACRLAGRSRSWFDNQNTLGTLPIAMQPRTSDNGRIFFSRADCMKYAQRNLLAPPPLPA
jgi:hypothetical protein